MYLYNPLLEYGLQYVPASTLDPTAIHKTDSNQIVNGSMTTATTGTRRTIDFSIPVDGTAISPTIKVINNYVATTPIGDAGMQVGITAGANFILNAWVSAANTITVWIRVSSYISVPAGSKYYVRILK